MTDLRGSLLLVDDNAMNRDMLSRRLEKRGHSVTQADSGPQALQQIEQQRFDVVLLDVMMPGMSGLEVLQRIRERFAPTDLTVIMVTAKDQTEDIVQALDLGANDYVTKPLNFPVVLARVQTQLALKRSVDEIRELKENLSRRNADLEAANTRLRAANRRMSRDLEAAARIQRAALPTNLPQIPGMQFAWAFRPCDELAGDLLNIVPLDEQRVGLFVLDVSGHGVPAALLSVTLSRHLTDVSSENSVLKQTADSPAPPAHVAKRLSTLFPYNPLTGQYFTLVYGVLDCATGEFRYVSAGHPPPLHVVSDAPPIMLAGRGLPIGITDSEVEYDEYAVQLQPGSRLYLFSDGLTEAHSPNSALFGPERLMRALDESRARPIQDSVSSLLETVQSWSGDAGLHDDVSILSVELARAC